MTGLRVARTVMNLEEYENQDGMKVWLSDDEVEMLLGHHDDTKKYISLALGARCGLRSEETIRVTPDDVVDTDAGLMLRVQGAKGGGYRETPVPEGLATRISTAADMRDESTDAPLVDVSKRTIRRWIGRTRDELAEETGDEYWQYLGYHDLRRTWATSLRSADVDAMVVCDWGGWDDLETFLDHYRGTHSPEAQRRERSKVAWL
jgi:integrase